MTIINKFGGEILSNPQLVKLTVKRLKEQLELNQKPVVVVSALAGVTDKLVKLCQSDDKKLLEELEKQHQDWMERLKVNGQRLEREVQSLKQGLEKNLRISRKIKAQLVIQDRILSYGEKWSSFLFTEFLIKQGIQAKRLTGEKIGLITDENFGDANILYEESLRNIKSKLKNVSQLPVITGFIGKSKYGQTTTLGRGGSDTTACLVGAALNPSKIILWKNVPGILSADPRIVKNPKLVKFLTYEEAEESGKVIHDKAISLVKEKGIGIEVAFIVDPEQKTVVGRKNNTPAKNGVKIISLKGNLQMFIISSEKITRPGAFYEIASNISKEGINMVLIRNTKESLYIVVEKNAHNLIVCRKKIEDLGYQVLAREVAMVNAVGSMDWKVVEKFNHLLYETCLEPDLGAFPYRNCHRLEAIVEIPKVNKLINIFHKEFIACE